LIGLYNQQYGMLMAGTLLAVVPVIALFFLLQKEFVAGLTAGAVKG
jgi:ABC-type glycerol-3-phosphate transport system permease component